MSLFDEFQNLEEVYQTEITLISAVGFYGISIIYLASVNRDIAVLIHLLGCMYSFFEVIFSYSRRKRKVLGKVVKQYEAEKVETGKSEKISEE